MVEALRQPKVLPCVYNQHSKLKETLKGLYEVLSCRLGGVLFSKDLQEFSSGDVVEVARLFKDLVA